MALTQRDCDRNYEHREFKGGQLFVRCDKLKGFALRVTENGAKSFTLDYTIAGKTRRRTIGQYPVISLPQAFAEALKLKADLRSGGNISPKMEPKPMLTLGELCDRYIHDYAMPHKKSWKHDQDRIVRHFSKLTHKAVDDVSVADCVELHQKINTERGPIEANRALQLLRSIYFKAQQWELTARQPIRLKMFTETPRERFLTPGEMVRVDEALMSEKDWRWKAYFPLALYLGTRKGELLKARWTDVNETAQTITFRGTKNGKDHFLPLPGPALDILSTLESRGVSEWLFPSKYTNNAHAENTSVFRAWSRIRQAAGVPDVHVHDLRRTFGSWLASGGIALPIIGRALNHSNAASTSIYARLQMDPVRAAMEGNAKAMALAAPEPPTFKNA
jgi:integrase